MASNPGTTPSFQVRRSSPAYPGGVPSKFSPDGQVQPFPGNTIVCHLPPSSALHTSLQELYAGLEASPQRQLFALLPPASWHMTVFEGVCDQVRYAAYWPSDLPLDAPLADVTAHFASKLRGWDLGDLAPPYRLRVVGFDPLRTGIGVSLEPATDEDARRIQSLRDRLAEKLGMRFPVHDRYGLHLSLAYFLRYLDEKQEREMKDFLGAWLEKLNQGEGGLVELGAPEFCTFVDMFWFERMFYLGRDE